MLDTNCGKWNVEVATTGIKRASLSVVFPFIAKSKIKTAEIIENAIRI
jgi:hypothetical protein